MGQFLHLMIVDRMQQAVLTTWCGGLWLLPMISAPETARIAPFVCRWLKERGIVGHPVGQWLGRLSSRQVTMDWLVTVDVGGQSRMVTSSGLRWVRLEALKSSASAIEYQQWAVVRVLSGHDGLSVPGPFGKPTWWCDVCAWIERALGNTTASTPPEVVSHRLSAYEVVLEWRTLHGRWFFKGLAADRIAEARFTSTMACLIPGSFARTVALEIRLDGSAWWLMEECPGTPLTKRLTIEGAVRVVEAYASVQQTMVGEVAAGRIVGLPAIDMLGLACWAKAMLADGDGGAASPSLTVPIDEACAEVGTLAPRSWVAADLDPTNVIIDGPHVRFIDLDDARIGPAPLAIATFVRRLERVGEKGAWTSGCSTRLLDTYDDTWTPRLNPSTLWPAIDLIAKLLDYQMGWQRVEAKIARGEVHDVRAAAHAAIRRRLLAAVSGRSAVRFS